MSEEPLILIHLSDIHFRYKRSGTPSDLDTDLRDELERDAAEMYKRLGNVQGILVTGDIAYSGKAEEYETANKWLIHLSKKLHCTDENIWTVPGNHDVDRSEIQGSEVIQSLHKELRSFREISQIDEEIHKKFIKDNEASNVLYRPLQNYSDFNKIFVGDTRKTNPFNWEYDLKLNDGSLLRLRGLNSTLVSDDSDDDESNKLIIGSLQVTLPNKEGVEYLTMCHHPPDWVFDKDNVESYLNQRARIQLYGHKHKQSINLIENSVRIIAGATHPDRTEDGWLPRYNFLAISVSKENGTRKLIVKVYPRVWSNDEKKFKGDYNSSGSDERESVFNLSDWSPLDECQADSSNTNAAVEALELSNTTKPSEITKDNMNPHRRLTYRFLSLPYNIRLKIALDLGLVLDEDEGLQEIERFRRVFQRAKDEKKLEKLWQDVEKAHGKCGDIDNPFKDT